MKSVRLKWMKHLTIYSHSFHTMRIAPTLKTKLTLWKCVDAEIVNTLILDTIRKTLYRKYTLARKDLLEEHIKK
ncbi:MAG: hypothetical protein U0L73_02545 [Ruminococcus bromii]|nr:hypothetical protein [Ruminococcus bromii]